ncbi:MAG: hypothetical protein ACOYBR_00745 [Fluviibacter sp.]
MLELKKSKDEISIVGNTATLPTSKEKLTNHSQKFTTVEQVRKAAGDLPRPIHHPLGLQIVSTEVQALLSAMARREWLVAKRLAGVQFNVTEQKLRESIRLLRSRQ